MGTLELPILLKMPVHPADNDLMGNETQVIEHLYAGKGYEQVRYFFPRLTATFAHQEEKSGAIRQVNAFLDTPGLCSLQKVREFYTNGIDARDMAWIWRRLLVALAFAHEQKVIHGSTLPGQILIHPEGHGVVLTDWSSALLAPAETGAYLTVIKNAWRDWYPAEVFARTTPGPDLDILLGARCMIFLLGGDPVHGNMPDRVPWQVQQHLRACLLPLPQQRPTDAGHLLADFDELIARLWGARTFHPFFMPGV
jgi:hypothetical protein